jgi:5-methyltetrahydrofolate--homocysteine methyltransferase
VSSEEQVCVYDPLMELMSRFENVRISDSSVNAFEGLTIQDQLKKHIVDGVKKNLDTRLDLAMEEMPPLSIINDVLLDGMKTVGELFGSGKMQLPFVLQSAEVMKASVRHLEPHMERTEGSEKGSMLLATVSGDVHDIGKNLVDIILTNNGYRVVNIGIKQPISNIIEQAVANKCEVIGMSGLLVKSTVIMRENLLELNARNLSKFPVILGGAALTRAYVEEDLRAIYDGQVFYAKDAFEGLHIMAEIGENSASVEADEADIPVRTRSHRVDYMDPVLYAFDGTKSDVEPVEKPPALPFYGAKKMTKFDIYELYKYINPISLFRGQWQFKRQEGMGNIEFNAWLEENVRPTYDRLCRELGRVLEPKVKWGYFPCQSEGNDLIIFHDDLKTERLRFTFPRQRDGRRLCLSDFFNSTTSGQLDTVGFSIVTAGEGISKREQELFDAGEYQDYLFTHGMGVETAEGLAEYWHRQMRIELGIDDQEPEEMRFLFSAKYHGARYSFGYPACPNLEDQTKLFELLQPEDIGLVLTEEFMLDPEQSTSAIVVHHPGAKYFNIR